MDSVSGLGPILVMEKAAMKYTLNHFGPAPDSNLYTVNLNKCSLPIISIFEQKMFRSFFETRSILIQSFLSKIVQYTRVFFQGKAIFNNTSSRS